MFEPLVYSTKNRPQRLCKMCGKCCKLAVSKYSFDEMIEFSTDKNSEASDFLDVFVPYENLDEPRKISPEYVDIIINKLKEQDKYIENEPVFYHCKYIMPDNRCSIYEKRSNICKRCPAHAWMLMPVGCGFSGWQFGLREQIMHDVRKLKEYLYECEILYGEGEIPSKNITVAQLRDLIYSKIKPYERFGSMCW